MCHYISIFENRYHISDYIEDDSALILRYLDDTFNVNFDLEPHIGNNLYFDPFKLTTTELDVSNNIHFLDLLVHLDPITNKIKIRTYDKRRDYNWPNNQFTYFSSNIHHKEIVHL